MNTKFISQGFDPESENSVGRHLITLFTDTDYHSFTGISAFLSEFAVKFLACEKEISKDYIADFMVVVGVSQKGTSKEALEELLDLNVNSYVFHMKKTKNIFHPKIYLFEGETKASLIIGSSNLTMRGLFMNIETSTLTEFDLLDIEDSIALQDFKDQYKTILDVSDPNIKVLTRELIDSLIAKRILPNEAERKERYDEVTDTSVDETNTEYDFPSKATPKLPDEAKRLLKTYSRLSAPVVPAAPVVPTIAPARGQPLWVRKKLPASSVQVPGAASTNPTGGLRLVQDNFKVGGIVIDQTSYFRNNVFGRLAWRTVTTHPLAELATGSFDVTILGRSYGIHNLNIRHKPSGEAGQGNYTTSISWGNLGQIIQGLHLQGRRFELYGPTTTNPNFQFVIL